MKEKKSDTDYPLPALRVAFRSSSAPAILRQLPENSKNKKELPGETGIEMEKGKIPEFYQHHIKPKKFDFF